MSRKIRIAIADDNTFLLKAIAEKLTYFEGADVRVRALNGQELLDKLCSSHNIDVVLMDIEMPVVNGIEATSLLKQRYPQIKVIMLTVFDNDENIFRSIKAGADGYLLKDVEAEDLYDGIIDTLNGGAAMNPSIAMKTLKLLRNPIDIDSVAEMDAVKLSSREIDVLEQLSKGLSYTIIADNLFLSPSTIRKHIENIYKKLQVHSKLEAVQKAKQNNII
ncbi:response regulator transcription factor [Flavobacterium sp. J372]|uniref:response regulator transcription factor n=1 Tax=Flavobacterium sp. J372 TaxID=2898436 RepID=UPI002151D859|nr:response regulator transcription factor [Flavobacterium sp. J372]MCR5861592.1 response regulator transcription factor [Flavobacterium sp. J372]